MEANTFQSFTMPWNIQQISKNITKISGIPTSLDGFILLLLLYYSNMQISTFSEYDFPFTLPNALKGNFKASILLKLISFW